MVKKILCCLLFILLFYFAAFAQTPGAADPGESGEKQIKNDKALTIDNKALTLEQIIDLVIRQNLTLQSAKYEIVMSDTMYEKAQKRYATFLNLDSGYANSEQTPSASTTYTGTKMWQYDASLSVARMFSTGTTIAAGVKDTFFDGNDQTITMPFPVAVNPATGALITTPITQYTAQPALHKPTLFVSIQQELLKNAFGYTDKRQDKILENAVQMQRAAIINQLSGLIVGALVDYWTISVQKSAVETAHAALDSNLRVRNIITRNAQYGLSEKYDINQYNSLVAMSESSLQSAEQRYREAVRKLLRSINMPPDTEVKGVTDLVDKLPALNPDEALKSGFEKRVDYKNSVLSIENAKMDFEVQKNNAMPSLTVSMGVNAQGQDHNFGKAFGQAGSFDYPSWQVRAKMSYPLNDSDAKVSVRNSFLKVKQAELNLENLKLEIRDDILNRMDQVNLQYQMLQKARIARAEAETYYASILQRFEQGKVGSVVMKIATDSMVQTRFQELNLLIQYNVSLLLFDLSKNEIFERYHIDVDKYLKDIKS